jgi:hypothetical protein
VDALLEHNEMETSEERGFTHYDVLVFLLGSDAGSIVPSPSRMLRSLKSFWEGTWRKRIGLETNAAKPRNAGRNWKRPDPKSSGERQHFIRAMVALLRLAPDRGFGPALYRADPDALRASSAAILTEIGPETAEALWEALASDVEWLANHPAAGSGPSRDRFAGIRRLRERSVLELRKVFTDPSIGGFHAIATRLKDLDTTSPAVLCEALRLSTRPSADDAERLAAQALAKRLRIHANREVAREVVRSLTRRAPARGGRIARRKRRR